MEKEKDMDKDIKAAGDLFKKGVVSKVKVKMGDKKLTMKAAKKGPAK